MHQIPILIPQINFFQSQKSQTNCCCISRSTGTLINSPIQRDVVIAGCWALWGASEPTRHWSKGSTPFQPSPPTNPFEAIIEYFSVDMNSTRFKQPIVGVRKAPGLLQRFSGMSKRWCESRVQNLPTRDLLLIGLILTYSVPNAVEPLLDITLSPYSPSSPTFVSKPITPTFLICSSP